MLVIFMKTVNLRVNAYRKLIEKLMRVPHSLSLKADNQI